MGRGREGAAGGRGAAAEPVAEPVGVGPGDVRLRCHMVLPALGQPEAVAGGGGRVGVAFVGTLGLSVAVGSAGAVAARPALLPLARLWDPGLLERLERVKH